MRSLCFVFLLFLSADLFAGLQLIVKERIPAYRKSKAKRPVFYLKPGMKVQISSRSRRGWRKIFIKKKGKTYKAWVNTRKFKKSKVLFSRKAELTDRNLRRSSMGLNLFVNSTFMGEQSISDGGGSSSNFDSMSGSSSYFGFYYEKPYKKKAYIRLSLSRSLVNVGGTGKYAGSGAEAKVEIKQSFTSVHFLYIKRFSKASSFWYGLGAGVDSGSSVELTINGTTEALTGDALPFYARLMSALAYEYYISKDFGVEGMLQLSYVANADKMILPVDLGLSLKKRF